MLSASIPCISNLVPKLLLSRSDLVAIEDKESLMSPAPMPKGAIPPNPSASQIKSAKTIDFEAEAKKDKKDAAPPQAAESEEAQKKSARAVEPATSQLKSDGPVDSDAAQKKSAATVGPVIPEADSEAEKKKSAATVEPVVFQGKVGKRKSGKSRGSASPAVKSGSASPTSVTPASPEGTSVMPDSLAPAK